MMEKKLLQKSLLLIIILMLIVIIPQKSFAIQPNQINGEYNNIGISIDFPTKVTDLVSKIGIFIAVGVLMILGIKYITGSIEDRATYKKSMAPYVIGCFLLFGASILAPQISDIFSDLGDTADDVGNNILGIIQVIGTLVAVGVLMVLGVKYMAGSAEERASYKKSMMPYVIGAIILFSAANLTALVYNTTRKVASREYTNGIANAKAFIDSVNGNYSEVDGHRQGVEANYSNWANAQGEGEDYYKGYLEELESWLSKNK